MKTRICDGEEVPEKEHQHTHKLTAIKQCIIVDYLPSEVIPELFLQKHEGDHEQMVLQWPCYIWFNQLRHTGKRCAWKRVDPDTVL